MTEVRTAVEVYRQELAELAQTEEEIRAAEPEEVRTIALGLVARLRRAMSTVADAVELAEQSRATVAGYRELLRSAGIRVPDDGEN